MMAQWEMSANSIIQFEYGTNNEFTFNSEFGAGEPVGVLAATAMSNPAYKAVLDSSPSSNSSWEMMKVNILKCFLVLSFFSFFVDCYLSLLYLPLIHLFTFWSQEILLCGVNFKNEVSDRRIILYLKDCGCGRTYCREKAACIIKNQLRKVSLKDAAVELLIEYASPCISFCTLFFCSNRISALDGLRISWCDMRLFSSLLDCYC